MVGDKRGKQGKRKEGNHKRVRERKKWIEEEREDGGSRGLKGGKGKGIEKEGENKIKEGREGGRHQGGGGVWMREGGRREGGRSE